ncbi:FAD-binding oxidoreductase [Vallitalea pronyensis]|uniref:FAD-binding oxidoreductase n=1 Tax=Vallitalea pronyensis TaxID=1348613 RepID=A0A8J8SHN6_9FIRM|nr:FAD-binding oxidoreductase [Vallitalea pronyensis]QUI24040.1 FAD-binding oxidoreductase [Vallitalea pronyensis]
MKRKTELTGTVVYPNDPAYEQARKNWNPFTDTFPIVFVFTHQTKDVINAVRWARENKVPIRIRSGRHALAKDFSQTHGGIVIDLGLMRGVKVNKVNGTAIVQPGIRVGDLVRKLAAQGILAPFGDSSSVGIGGISTGGGITVVQRTTGLISDNIMAATLVDANGKVIYADEYDNEDLLWAIRGGGGGNFGIITSYKFKVRQAPFKVGIYQVIWPWEQLEEVIDGWQQWAPYVDDRLGSVLEAFSRMNGVLRSQGVFLGPKEELEDLISPLTGVGTPIKVMVKEVSLLEAIDFWIPNEPLSIDQNTTFSSTWLEQDLPEEGLKTVRRFLERTTGTSNFFLLNSGGAMNSVPPNKTAFYWRNTRYYMEWNTKWTCPDETQRNLKLMDKTRIALQPYTIGSYVNVPDLAIRDYGQEYYGKNFNRLRKIKAKYDPDNVFNFIQSIPPASSCKW